MNRANVEDLPVTWVEPEGGSVGRNLVIWLPGFGGTKEGMDPYLHDLAGAGYVGLAFDPHQHGDRRIESQDELRDRILGNIRRHFWPILAHTSEEVPTVIDWALHELSIDRQVGIGGISMGGDIAIAAAGLDPRITAVSACLATPDWLRPGSHEPPGEPDEYAQSCYDRLNPLTHLERYRHCPALALQCGELDTQVPPDGGERFVNALAATYASYPERLQVFLYPATPHRFTDDIWRASLKWLGKFLRGP